jgi:hypothetical protein
MSMRKFLILSASATLAFAVHANEASKQPSAIDARIASTMVGIEHAIYDFIAACASNDANRLSEITTDDVRIEYALENPGTYYGVDATSLATECSLGSAAAQLANLRIYPTGEEDVVFVEFDMANLATPALVKSHLAIVEMQAHRIARIVNLSSPPDVGISASTSDTKRGARVAMQESGR